MKMLYIDRSGIGSHRGKAWRSLGFALLLLVSSEGVTAQKAPEVLPAPIRGASVLQPAANMPAIEAKIPNAAPVTLLTGITTSQEKGSVVVSVTANAPLRHKAYLFDGPSRLVVDFSNVESRVPFRRLAINSGNVSKLRVGEFIRGDRKITRLVFDLQKGFEKYEVKTDGNSVLIIFPEGKASMQAASIPAPPAPERSVAPKPASAPSKPNMVTKPTPGAVPEAVASPRSDPQLKVTEIPRSPAPSVKQNADASAFKPVPIQISPPEPPVRTQVQDQGPPLPAPTVPVASKKEVPPSPVVPTAQAALEQPPPSPAPTMQPASTQAPPSPVVPNAQAALGQPAPTPVPTADAASRQASPAPAPTAQAAQGQEPRYSGTPLTLDLVDIALVDFFRLLAEEGGINVVMDPEIKGTLSMKVVKVPWDQIFEAALMNNGLDKQIDGNLVRIARKATLQEEAKQRESLKKANLLAADVETRIKRLNYAKASTLIPTLVEQKSVRGTVVFDERTNSLILTDLPSSIQKMVGLVETLDIPQPQVEIEARIVSATRDFARDIGVQFGFVQGNLERVTVGGPNTFGTIGGTRPSATPTSTYAAGNPRTGRGAAEGTSTQSAGVSTGTGTGTPAGNLNVNLAAAKAFGGLGISVGNIFDTFLLDAAITAGENKGLAKLISQPKTVTTNNSPATITQGLRFPVQIVANNTVTVQFQNAALTLVATPQITYEGNVILDLQIENNTPDFSHAVNGIPSIRTSESKTRVLVTDGGTTVIGGILIENEETSEDRIPGLASLPGIGYLFKRTQVSHTTQEVLFFITPKVIK